MKRRASGGEMNLDSLLDTLTNVVGVLVMVLMLVSLNVQKAVERIRDLDPSQLGVSEADLAKLRAQADAAREKREQLKNAADQAEITANQTELAASFNRLILLKQNVPLPKPAPTVKLEDLTKQVTEQSKKSQTLASQLTKAEEELARLKALLAKTPELGPAPEAKLVSLPNPREAPKGAKQVIFICREDKVFPFDPNDLRDRAKKRAEALLKPMRIRAKGGPIDCQELVEQFNKAATTDAIAKSTLGIENFNLYLYYDYKSVGESARQVGGQYSAFRRFVRKLDKTKQYATFLVWNDSFEAYVEARRVCDEEGLLAGWQPLAENYVYKIGLGIAVDCEGKPAPKPPAPGTPSPAPRPAGPPPVPNDVVD